MVWASLPRIFCLSVAATTITFAVSQQTSFHRKSEQIPMLLPFLPSSVLGCSVTHPVWMYSMSCLKTSGSNSSMIRVWCWRWSPPEEEEAPEAEEEQEGCVRRM